MLKEQKIKISSSTKLGELFREHPHAHKVLKKHKFACSLCGGQEHETIEMAARCHGFDVILLMRELENDPSGED